MHIPALHNCFLPVMFCGIYCLHLIHLNAGYMELNIAQKGAQLRTKDNLKTLIYT